MGAWNDLTTSFTETHVPLLAIGLRLATAVLLGLLIGWDRERRSHAAGLRTMAIVSLGSAGFVLATIEIAYGLDRDEGLIEFDPARVIGGIVGGIGFLGAGAIIKSAGHVQGLTTAAAIWATAAVGLAAGAGLYPLALLLTAFALFILQTLRRAKGELLPDKRANPEAPAPTGHPNHAP
mgnify:CR=1 FL=1